MKCHNLQGLCTLCQVMMGPRRCAPPTKQPSQSKNDKNSKTGHMTTLFVKMVKNQRFKSGQMTSTTVMLRTVLGGKLYVDSNWSLLRSKALKYYKDIYWSTFVFYTVSSTHMCLCMPIKHTTFVCVCVLLFLCAFLSA